MVNIRPIDSIISPSRLQTQLVRRNTHCEFRTGQVCRVGDSSLSQRESELCFSANEYGADQIARRALDDSTRRELLRGRVRQTSKNISAIVPTEIESVARDLERADQFEKKRKTPRVT